MLSQSSAHLLPKCFALAILACALSHSLAAAGPWHPYHFALGDGPFIHTYPTLPGDVDGDGLTDLIFVGQGWSGKGLNVRVKFSQGDGTWQAVSQVLGDASTVHTYPTLTGDVNGDGLTDLVFAGQGWSGAGLNVRTKMSRGDGTWTSYSQVLGDAVSVHAYPTLAGDVNGDGKTDLIFVGQGWSGKGLNIRTKISKGTGVWTSYSQVLGDGPEVHKYPVLTGDVNGDKRTDLIFIGQDWSGAGLNVRVQLSNGNGTWATVKSVLGDKSYVHDRPALAGDVNGDGRTDLIFVGQDWDGAGLNVRVKLAKADGTWKAASGVLGDGPGVHDRPAQVADVNGDGKADLLFTGLGWDGAGLNVRAKLSNGDGTWMNVSAVLGDGKVVLDRPTLAGDVDGDGLQDLIFAGQSFQEAGLNIRVKAYIGPRARILFSSFERLATDMGVSNAVLDTYRAAGSIEREQAATILSAFGDLQSLPECDRTAFQDAVILASRDHTQGDGGGTILPACGDEHPEHVLTNNLVLPAVDGNADVQVGLTPNAFVPRPFTAEVLSGELPRGLTFLTDNLQQILIAGKTAPDARTSTFTIRLRDGATGAVRVDYQVTQPVNLGIHRIGEDEWAPPQLFFSLDPNGVSASSTVATFLHGSGAPVASRPMAWSYLPSNSARPLSVTGYSMQTLPDGNLGLAGSLAYGASSSAGSIRLTQNGVTVSRPVVFDVNVHFLPQAGLEKRSFQRWVLPQIELEKYTPFSLVLPRPYGGDGAFYGWSDPRGELPPGLAIVAGANGAQRVEGSMTEAAPHGARSVRLQVGSTLGQAATVQLDFVILPKVIADFDVWTQNTLLRPPSLPAEILGALAVAFFWQPWLPGALAIFWSDTMDNTDHDNAQRTERILEQTLDRRIPYPIPNILNPVPPGVPFDLVALQEVFDDDSRESFEQDAPRFTKQWGPPRLDFEDNSGLLLLVQRGWQVVWNHHEAFKDAPSIDEVLTEGVVEGLVQKGFSLSKIQIGGPGDYIYVVNTHTQSLVDYADMRAKQLGQIRAAIDRHADYDHPVLFLGDFNVIGETPEYAEMIRIFGYPDDLYREAFPDASTHPGYTCDVTRSAYAYYWFGETGEPDQQRVDYMLVRQGNRYVLELKSISVTDTHYETSIYSSQGWSGSGHKSYLSDHWGLKAELTLVHN